MLAGDEHVQLTRREGEVFAVLAARIGVVMSPATLLRTVWGDASADEHVVGVTVGRLRRKLGGWVRRSAPSPAAVTGSTSRHPPTELHVDGAGSPATRSANHARTSDRAAMITLLCVAPGKVT